MEALPWLRDRGLLSVGLLEALPIRSADFPAGAMFFPIYLAVRDAVRDQPFLPAHGGGFVSAKEAKLARGAGLLDLLSPKQLGDLFQRNGPLWWLAPEISEARTPELRYYLMGNRSDWYRDVRTPADVFDEVEVRPETVVRNLTHQFMGKQDDAWVGRFYAFLGRQQNVWSLLGDKRFLRLQDGVHVPLRDPAGAPRAYLPTEGDVDVPTVKREVIATGEALAFLKGIGLVEPDVSTHVLTKVLPKYTRQGAEAGMDDAEHKRDIEDILRALEAGTQDARFDLKRRLCETPFLRGRNAATGKRAMKPPKVLYAPSAELQHYFDGNPAAWLADACYSPFLDRLVQSGIRTSVSVTRRDPTAQGHVVLASLPGRYERGLEGFDPGFDIDGLGHALGNMTSDKARFIWNYLLQRYPRAIRGVVEHSTRQSFEAPRQERQVSTAGRMLIEAAWLPGPGGRWYRPSDLSLDDLPDGFERSEKLADALGMKPAVLAELAHRYHVEPDTLRFLLEHPNEVKELKRKLDAQRVRDDEHGRALGGGALDYGDAFSMAFAKPGKDAEADAHLPPAPVPNPGHRRTQVHAEIQGARSSEPPTFERFTRVAMRVWERKDNAVRAFLLAEYGGRCQICDATFRRRDGQPYFEGLYLVSHTEARWVDREGNVLCLCATCCAKFLHGSVEADDVRDQVHALRTLREGGEGHPALRMTLCGEPARVRFTERHMIDLQELVKASEGG